MNGTKIRRLLGLVWKERRCNVCGWRGFRFEPFGNQSTYRKDACCPICGSLERHRAVRLMLGDKILPGQKVLHFAPEALMVQWLVAKSCEYLNVDLYNPAMRKMDITNIELPDESRTLVWCSHVLEHIPDDRKALQEIHRVLSPGGMLVLQVPINGETTYENPEVQTDADRLQHFLQEDHVRLYGRDLKKRIEQCGFACELLSTTSLPVSEQVLHSIRSPLYNDIFVCRKSAKV